MSAAQNQDNIIFPVRGRESADAGTNLVNARFEEATAGNNDQNPQMIQDMPEVVKRDVLSLLSGRRLVTLSGKDSTVQLWIGEHACILVSLDSPGDDRQSCVSIGFHPYQNGAPGEIHYNPGNITVSLMRVNAPQEVYHSNNFLGVLYVDGLDPGAEYTVHAEQRDGTGAELAINVG